MSTSTTTIRGFLGYAEAGQAAIESGYEPVARAPNVWH